MKKLTILIAILAFLFLPMGAWAAPAYGNLGPTSEIGFDIYMQDELVFEGSAADEHETTLTVTNPTADRTITVPDSDQTIGTATSIEDELIVEADLDGDEAPSDNDILTYDTTGANFSWQTPAELELVTTSGTPSDSQIAVWTADGIIEGAADLTYDGSNLQLTGDIGSTGTKITKGWFTDLVVTNAIAGSVTGNAATITITDDEDQAEENEIPFVADAGTPGADKVLESDSGFTYNPSTGTVTAAAFAGDITGALTGNADTVTVDATTTDETCFILLGESDSGSLEPQTDATLTYNASTGLFFSTIITGEIRLATTDADPDTTGEIRHDSTVASMAGGALRWFDDGSARVLVDLETDAVEGNDDYVVAYDWDAKGFYMKEDATSGANWILHLMDVDAADADYVHASIDANGDKIGTIASQPDYGRNITVTGVAGASGTVTITGTLANGTTAQSDEIAIPDDGITQGVKAFVNITAIVVADIANTCTVGIGDLIGLPNSISAESDIYMKTVDGADEFHEISGNGNTTNNTLDCGTIVQNEDITLYYHN